MNRIWHWLVGHRWVEHSAMAFKGTNKIGYSGWLESDDERMECYGFTDIDFLCSCGAHKRHRLMGVREPAKDSEIAELRRMAKL